VKDFVRRGIACLVFAVLTAAVEAQASLKVTPNGPTPGQAVRIDYSNPAMAGRTVDILISDGCFPNPQTATVTITLDAVGNAVGGWTIPAGWSRAIFSAPGTDDVTIWIDDGEALLPACARVGAG
jgi:hypothetical protein